MAKSFLFDNGFAQPTGQSLTFNGGTSGYRGWDTKKSDGSTVTGNNARYTHNLRMLCGAPAITTHVPRNTTTDGRSHTAHAGGFDKDGTTRLFVYYKVEKVRLEIHRGSFSTNPLYWKQVLVDDQQDPQNPKNGQGDILFDEPDEETSRIHNPAHYLVCLGMVVAICEVSDYVSSPSPHWRPIGISLCVWQGSSWSLWAHTAYDQQVGKRRASFFSCQGYTTFASGLDSAGRIAAVYICLCDYVSNDGQPTISNGGQYFIFKATRSFNGNNPTDWAPGTLVPALTLIPRSDESDTHPVYYHAHPPLLQPYGSGMRLVCPVGDDDPNNRAMVIYRGNETYTQGGSTPGASPYDEGIQNGWTTFDNANGTHVPLTGPDSNPLGSGNQFVASCPLGPRREPRGHLVGGDEVVTPLMQLPVAATQETRVNFYHVHGTGCAAINPTDKASYRFNCFHALSYAETSAGPWAVLVAPGAGSGAPWAYEDWATRILYSLDGLTFGQCWAPGYADIKPFAFFRDTSGARIFYGIWDRVNNNAYDRQGFGLLSIPVPVTTVQRPLEVGTAGKNLMLSETSIPAPVNVQSTNTVLSGVDPADYGAPYPPCYGRVYRCTRPVNTSTADSERLMGTWKLTATGAVRPGKIKVRLWVYIIPAGTVLPDNSTAGVSNALTLEIAIGQHDPALFPAVNIGDRREAFTIGQIPAVGTWIPITFDTDTTASSTSGRAWTDDANNLAAPTVNFTLGLRIRNRAGPLGTPANPCDFLMVPDYVLAPVDGSGNAVATEHPSIALPQDSTSYGPEKPEVGTFACPDNSAWTASLAALLGDSGWDQTDTDRPTPYPAAWTLMESESRYIEIRPRPDLRKLELTFYSDQISQPVVKTIDPPMVGSTGIAAQFFFLRGSPLLFGLSCSATGTATYRYAASVGGTEAVTGSFTDAPVIKPTKIRLGNKDQGGNAPLLHFGGKVDEASADSESTLASTLRNLGMLFRRLETAAPPEFED